MDDQVATEDREARVGALVAGVHRAVDVLDDVLDDQLLLGAEAYLLCGLGRGRLLLLDQRGPRGVGEQLRGSGEGAALPAAGWAEAPVVTPVASRAPAATAVAMARVVRL